MSGRIGDRLANRARRGEEAQGVLEFAFIATILMLMFLGTVDFARFMYYQTAITSAARVGAETASNHCPFAAQACGTTSTPVSDTLVLWDTYCEAVPAPKLHPQYSSCEPNGTNGWTPICVGTCTNCAQDMCVTPASRTQGTQVMVSIGWNFRPFTPLMNLFFTDTSCWSAVTVNGVQYQDDPSSNHHTICAHAVGRVS